MLVAAQPSSLVSKMVLFLPSSLLAKGAAMAEEAARKALAIVENFIFGDER